MKKEILMKKRFKAMPLIVLAALFVLAAFQACSDSNVKNPMGPFPVIESTASSASLTSSAGVNEEPKMVPFKGKGTYKYIKYLPDFEKMEIEITVAIEGTATQLGRFQGEMSVLFEFMLIDEMPVPTGYLSHSGKFTAANGDELHNDGSADNGTYLEFTMPPGSGFSLTGIHIVGGTGRFENAVGKFVLLVSRDPYDPAPPGGTWEIEGQISTVGSTKSLPGR